MTRGRNEVKSEREREMMEEREEKKGEREIESE